MSETEIVTFGCRLNIYESEVIKNLALKSNAIIFNTCAVTSEAERQARQSIRAYRLSNPDKKIIVTGCAAQINPTQFEKMDEVDLIIGNEEKLKASSYDINDTDDKIHVSDIMQISKISPHLVSSFEGRVRAFVQIQNGCNHRCTFCIIPYARGNSRSVTVGALTNQIKELLSSGYKEIVLTGVDITDWGKDLPGSPTLANLIKRLLILIPEIERLRLSSIDVAEIDDELFDIMVNEKRLMPHIHISLQSGDNMILKRMKRRHKREDVIKFCENLRKFRSNIAFGADIIAGFPTETDEMFENTLNLISEIQIQYLHVFPYSERTGTPASKMPQIEKKIRKKRAAILREAGKVELMKFLNSQINSISKVLIENDNFGRTENFLSVKLNVNTKAGDLVDCLITSTNDKILLGTAI